MANESPKVLVIFAHPAFERSRTQARLMSALEASLASMPNLTFHDLYETYPKKIISVRQEQALLADHDIVVLQYPLYWYQPPALLKEWMDLVLQYGWAYGPKGTALAGKQFRLALSVGGSRENYSATGQHGHELAQFLIPMRKSAEICHMDWREPFVVYDAVHVSEQELDQTADKYMSYLTSLAEG